ncbi:hypothetical protein M501DRAFT_1032970 [Patellaria atrata CBS 101060]|uniref:precorrin-2 dehydrogenase n=1 Tax=Patellaria atrata CBS 101060 TaxID=1346257 RepID=A0A9P4S6Z9_9PEZI|nr:hypothetical protein M501DRAFT_1032970 [Patellaria atrata CBS 101060]
MKGPFPEVQGGGSLILAWQVRNKRVLVVGGGEVAAGRILNVLNADAKVTVVSPREGLNDEVAYRVEQNQVDYVDRKFEPSDLNGVDMVLTAVDDPEASTQIYKLCKERRIAANIADVPPECDFYFGSVHRDGPLQIMVSTNGNGPKLANIVRRQIAANLPKNIGAAITKVGTLRRKLRKVAPTQEEGPKRMQWMSKVCESWSLEELCDMDEEDMERLLGFYKPGIVPAFEEIRLGQNQPFDGAFGWCHDRQDIFRNHKLQLRYFTITIDFESLALQDADFNKIYTQNKGKIDFQDPTALQQLTKSLLKRDFDIKLELPDDRLCPPVPVRYNYVRWVQTLLDTTSDSYTDEYNPSRQVIGIDIGVGASCIYPLLACSTRPQWRIGGTEIDPKSLSSAKANIALNNFQPRIRLLQTTSSDSLIPLDELGIQHADFTMCNPPFFASKAEMDASYAGEGKRKKPSAVCTGAEIEMVCGGGDAGFVCRMMEESKGLKDRVQWFTSMLGKLSSLGVVVTRLKEAGVANWAVATLRAGNKTRRWAVAWSWGKMRPLNDVARSHEISSKELLPFPTHFSIPTPGKDTILMAATVNQTLSSLDLQWIWKESKMAGVALAEENVWSRSARRKRKKQELIKFPSEDNMDSDEEEDDSPLGVKITVLKDEVCLRWLRGNESVLFESFCGMLKRALDNSKVG